ncbi:MAG: hypothetical protein WD073_08995 [Xanthobacteraceae bacterium]
MKAHAFTLAAAMAAAIAWPAYADQKQQAAGKTSSKGKVAQSVDRQYGQTPGQAAYSIYVHKPEYDVYVNGQYAGSDPDPHVRRQLRREWCEDSADGCGFRFRD